jgi:hypothetical protein
MPVYLNHALYLFSTSPTRSHLYKSVEKRARYIALLLLVVRKGARGDRNFLRALIELDLTQIYLLFPRRKGQWLCTYSPCKSVEDFRGTKLQQNLFQLEPFIPIIHTILAHLSI